MISNITPKFAACSRTAQFGQQAIARPQQQQQVEQPQVLFSSKGRKAVAQKKSKWGIGAAVLLGVATFPLSGPLAVVAGLGAAGSALYAAQKNGEAKSEL